MRSGKGIFIYQGRNCAAGDIGAAISDCQAMGLSHVLLKIGDATNSLRQSYSDMAGARLRFKQAGIAVWLWHYVYGGVWIDKSGVQHEDGATPEEEAQFALQAINQLNPDGYVIDAEVEYECLGQQERAKRFMAALGKPGVPVALSSFRFPLSHSNFPWKEFLAGCDISMPQIYWLPGGASSETTKSIQQWQMIQQLPLMATGRAYIGDAHLDLQPSELTEFMGAAFGAGATAVNFWVLDSLYLQPGGPGWKEAITSYRVEAKMNTLPVPYVSQLGPGAQQHNKDCGAASGLMLLQTYGIGKYMTVDQFYDRVQPNGDTPLSAGDIGIALADIGLKNDWKAGLLIHDLYDCLMNKKPVIALIHYDPLVQAGLSEKNDFHGAHFIVVTGADIEAVAIHDPYRDDNRGNVEIPIDVFHQCWIQAEQDGNPTCAGLVPTIPIQDLSSSTPSGDKYALQVNGINVRSGPGDSYPIVRVIWKTSTPIVQIVKVSGDRGNLAEGGWVYMPYLAKTN